MKTCDHSTGGAIIGGALVRAGYRGVFRYAAGGRGDVNITPAEVRDLEAHGIAIAIVNEFAANYLLGGYNVGHDSAIGARDITRACGLPDGVVFMAGDFDATNSSPASPDHSHMKAISSALDGAIAALGKGNVGFYGGYYAIDWLVKHGPPGILYWQCMSAYGAPGVLHPKACTIQRLSSPTVGGVQLDDNASLMDFWGQRGVQPSPHPNPPPTPPLPPDHPEGSMITAVANHDGRLEFIHEDKDGGIWHTWQTSPGGGFYGSKPGHYCTWVFLGNPGSAKKASPATSVDVPEPEAQVEEQT